MQLTNSGVCTITEMLQSLLLRMSVNRKTSSNAATICADQTKNNKTHRSGSYSREPHNQQHVARVPISHSDNTARLLFNINTTVQASENQRLDYKYNENHGIQYQV